MRILICLSSTLRGFDAFTKSFSRRVIARLPVTPDIACHFWRPGSAETLDAPKALRPLADKFVLRFSSPPTFTFAGHFAQGMSRQRSGIEGNLQQWFAMKLCEQLKRQLEAEHGPYDLVIWSRPDLYFVTPIEDAIETDALYVPVHDSWGGVHDRFCYGPSELMSRRLRIFDYFSNDWHPAFLRGDIAAKHHSGKWNAEAVLADLLQDEPVRESQVVVCKVRDRDGGEFLVRPILNGVDSSGPIVEHAMQVFQQANRADVSRNNGQYTIEDVRQYEA